MPDHPHSDLVDELLGPMCLDAAVVEKRLRKAAAALEQQAKRIAELEAENAALQTVADTKVDDLIGKIKKRVDADIDRLMAVAYVRGEYDA